MQQKSRVRKWMHRWILSIYRFLTHISWSGQQCIKEYKCIKCLDIFKICIENSTCFECKDSNLYGALCDQRCSKNCAETHDRVCGAIQGECVNGCKAGWFGSHCNAPCNENCKDHICDRINGSCNTGCTNGFTGTMCTRGRDIYI